MYTKAYLVVNNFRDAHSGILITFVCAVNTSDR